MNRKLAALVMPPTTASRSLAHPPGVILNQIIRTTILLSLTSISLETGATPIIQPSAPGQTSTQLTAEQAIKIANTSYTPGDAQFMRDMIPHHQQALEMSQLAPNRTNSPEILEIAGRIEAAQGDEIAFMEQWLMSRGESLSRFSDQHEHHTMRGMATPEQVENLAGASATDFDRQFLTLMITHHEGALHMVEDLMEQPGAAYDPMLFEFTNDVTNDQSKEIERMHEVLLGLSDDPRARLAPGFDNAEEAIWNLRKVAVLSKPAGFYDPANPAELPPERFLPSDSDQDDNSSILAMANTPDDFSGSTSDSHHHDVTHSREPATTGDTKHDTGTMHHTVSSTELETDNTVADSTSTGDDEERDEPEPRSPMLSFSNTDIAFRDDIMVAGSYHGFNIYQLDESGVPELTASVVCPGGQGDVSIVDHLLIMSVEETRGRVDCGLQGVRAEVSEERFRGLRIFDISELTRPIQVGAVQTCRGSHTHSVVSGPDADGNIIIYNSGISRVRDEEELPGCFDESPGDDRTALFRIDVIEIPIHNPAEARIIDSPAVFADPKTGALAGLWRGGDHGEDTQETYRTDQCHDITVYPELNIAAGACSGNGILFDITDPRAPERIDAVNDTGFAYWHSATFNNDGTKVLFTDEWGGGTRPRCRAYDPLTWGADAIYDILDNKLVFQSHFKIPAPQGETENCVAHNGSIIPVPGRDIFVQAWYQGGVSVVDFTDSANPIEIAYFDRGPIDADDLVTGGYWSTYWYQGKIYGTEIIRGIDVLALVPSEHLTENEIAAAGLADQGNVFNPQQQFPVSWPVAPVVSMAYLDQLVRANPDHAQTLVPLYETLQAAESLLEKNGQDTTIASSLTDWAESPALAQADALRDSLYDLSKRLGVPAPARLISQTAP